MRSRRTTDAALVGTTRRTLPGSVRWTEAQPPDPRGGAPAAVHLRALGPLEAVVGDRLVDLGTPKQRALLALLVSRVGQPVAVDVMLEALWAGHPPPSAITSLQAYVANLRKVLEPDRAPRTPATVLRTCSQGYLLDDRAVDVDVHRFGEHATAGWQALERGDSRPALSEFEAGLALWRGRPYSEVAGATWVAPEVARLDELRLSVVEARCAALLAVGAHEVAVAELEAFVQAHPLREYGCELLTLALYRAGRQADALNVLRTIQSRLAEELGVDPRPALKQLEHEILNQSPTLDWQPTPAAPTIPATRAAGGSSVVPQVRVTGAPPTPVPDGEVFVGREAELRQLADALASASTGRCRVVTVSGEPEIGKTSLLRRFAERAGGPVLWGTCPEHVDAPPLWLWEQVLRGAATCFPHVPAPPPVAELLDGDAGRRADDPGADLRRFEAIVRYLADVSDAAPLVILLDHAHRADPCSLRLLAHLAESAPASRLLLVVSYRSDEAAVLAGPLAALARTEVARIELAGLDVQQTRTLASTVLRREVGGRTAQALWARSEGNPFFLRELLGLSTTDQGLDRQHPVPPRVREVVLRRVARLPRTAAELLSVAAVAGRHFDIEIVAEAASVEVEAALEALDTAIEAGLVVEDQHRLGWFRFTHALAAETLYETTGRLRRALVHRRIGAAAARVWTGSTEKAAEIARHWLPAAELDSTAAAQACAHAATAARVADARLPEDAARLWRQALAAADLAEREDLDRHSLLIGLGASLYRSENFRDGLLVFIRALEEILAAPGALDTSRLVTTAVAAVGELDLCPDAPGEVDERLVGVLERALPRVTDPVRRAHLLSCLAVARRHDGDPAGRSAVSDEALALAWLSTETGDLADVLHLRAVALNGPDHLDQRLKAVTELLALPGLPPPAAARARRLTAHALLVLGRVREAAAELDLAAEHAGSPALRTRLGWSRAALLLLDGRWAEADEVSRATYEQCARTSWDDARFHRVVQRWEAAYLTGGGQYLVDDLRSAAESSGRPAAQALLVLALVDAGRARDARIALHRFPRGPEEDDLWLYARCWALLAAARLGESDLVARWRAQLLPYRHLACAAPDLVVSGSVAYFTAEAALALGDPDAALADLAVATDAARRMGALPWLARVREAVEVAHRLEAAPCV